MEITVFEGAVRMGDSASATMVFAQDFRVPQCALGERKLALQCEGVEILGPPEHREISAHAVYVDHLLVGRLDGDRAEFTLLPAIDAGVHRVSVHVSTFPGHGLCDDFTLQRIVFTCK